MRETSHFDLSDAFERCVFSESCHSEEVLFVLGDLEVSTVRIGISTYSRTGSYLQEVFLEHIADHLIIEMGPEAKPYVATLGAALTPRLAEVAAMRERNVLLAAKE